MASADKFGLGLLQGISSGVGQVPARRQEQRRQAEYDEDRRLREDDRRQQADERNRQQIQQRFANGDEEGAIKQAVAQGNPDLADELRARQGAQKEQGVQSAIGSSVAALGAAQQGMGSRDLAKTQQARSFATQGAQAALAPINPQTRVEVPAMQGPTPGVVGTSRGTAGLSSDQLRRTADAWQASRGAEIALGQQEQGIYRTQQELSAAEQFLQSIDARAQQGYAPTDTDKRSIERFFLLKYPDMGPQDAARLAARQYDDLTMAGKTALFNGMVKAKADPATIRASFDKIGYEGLPPWAMDMLKGMEDGRITDQAREALDLAMSTHSYKTALDVAQKTPELKHLVPPLESAAQWQAQNPSGIAGDVQRALITDAVDSIVIDPETGRRDYSRLSGANLEKVLAPIAALVQRLESGAPPPSSDDNPRSFVDEASALLQEVSGNRQQQEAARIQAIVLKEYGPEEAQRVMGELKAKFPHLFKEEQGLLQGIGQRAASTVQGLVKGLDRVSRSPAGQEEGGDIYRFLTDPEYFQANRAKMGL